MPHLIYIADPMCSWCWGFSPVISGLAERFGERAPIQLLMGGLRPYTVEPLSAEDSAMIREHWGHVAERTGQPFDFAFFDRPTFVYDTEPASRAVITARNLRPGTEVGFLKAVQHAFYAGNQDITDEAVLTGIAEADGFDGPEFAEALASEAAREATRRDFAVSQQAGIRGFPTLLAGEPPTGYTIVTHGYQPLATLAELLDQWLTRQTAANDA
jgi:putative protein-disulfide isomerase